MSFSVSASSGRGDLPDAEVAVERVARGALGAEDGPAPRQAARSGLLKGGPGGLAEDPLLVQRRRSRETRTPFENMCVANDERLAAPLAEPLVAAEDREAEEKARERRRPASGAAAGASDEERRGAPPRGDERTSRRVETSDARRGLAPRKSARDGSGRAPSQRRIAGRGDGRPRAAWKPARSADVPRAGRPVLLAQRREREVGAGEEEADAGPEDEAREVRRVEEAVPEGAGRDPAPRRQHEAEDPLDDDERHVGRERVEPDDQEVRPRPRPCPTWRGTGAP